MSPRNWCSTRSLPAAAQSSPEAPVPATVCDASLCSPSVPVVRSMSRIATTAGSDVSTAGVRYPDSEHPANRVAEAETLSHIANRVDSVTPYG